MDILQDSMSSHFEPEIPQVVGAAGLEVRGEVWSGNSGLRV